MLNELPFFTYREIDEALVYAREYGDDNVTDKQRSYGIGDIVVSVSKFGFMYQVILDPEEHVKEEIEKFGSRVENYGMTVLGELRQPEFRNFCLAENYSRVFPFGRVGYIHRSTIEFSISRRVFEALRNNWFRRGRC